VAKHHRKRLLVEGKEDSLAVSCLMDAHIAWGDNRDQWPLLIEEFDGVEKLLADGVISRHLKSSEIDHVGIILDADQEPLKRWSRIRRLCADVVPTLPEILPDGGLVTATSSGKTFGFWMMPDNISAGMLETFLTLLVPEPARPLWDYAVSAVDQSKSHGSPFKAIHSDKARLHTWLAWQDPPGISFLTALLQKSLDPKCDVATPFVTWFRTLYGL
jgi:hypothetical protein